ncbi:unnamed protein product [Strongylus vulgaris]|uniref:Uncharacterized protein n=1 Tax=Strongylus vulgaris TaxID=40348 RepID=A0A3P7JT24_STRVU|nr:unnamed protein product [Strongylus vulgaris]
MGRAMARWRHTYDVSARTTLTHTGAFRWHATDRQLEAAQRVNIGINRRPTPQTTTTTLGHKRIGCVCA